MKFIIQTICLALAIGYISAGYIPTDHGHFSQYIIHEDGNHLQHIEDHHDHHDHHDYHVPAQYKYGYSVHDPHTGDNKEAWEHRDGDSVKGSYSLVEPDGTKRIVDYQADKHLGFIATVKRVGHHGTEIEHYPSHF